MQQIKLDNNRITLLQGDCFDWLPKIKEHCIDMVFADLPYGTTANKWDSVLPLDQLWANLKRLGKDTTPYVFTATMPFSATLVTSNLTLFKYEWIWYKNIGTGYQIVRYKPMQRHETIQVFYKDTPTYNPQMVTGKAYTNKRKPQYDFGSHLYGNTIRKDTVNEGTRYPHTVLSIDREIGLHPTQKPVALLEYLIKTYTNENDVILDPTAGSFTTTVACINTNRRCIAIEQNQDYFDIGIKRCEEAINAKQ